MRTKLMMLMLVLLGLMASREAQAFYNPSTGRWLSRDPVAEKGGLNIYCSVRNDPNNSFDALGLESEPDVNWGPAPCPRGQTTAYIQVVKGYTWSDGGPHVDNGSLGPKSSTSTGCPLYPLPPGMKTTFQDTPRGWTGSLQFIVCRVCLEPCQLIEIRGKNRTRFCVSGYQIVSVGPCVYWKKGDKGDLSDKSVFTIVDGPNQDWQVGMDKDFPNAAKGGCFRCTE
jgi:hypothetical protein